MEKFKRLCTQFMLPNVQATGEALHIKYYKILPNFLQCLNKVMSECGHFLFPLQK